MSVRESGPLSLMLLVKPKRKGEGGRERERASEQSKFATSGVFFSREFSRFHSVRRRESER